MSAKRYNSPAILFLDKDGPLVTFADYERLRAALAHIASIEPVQGKASRNRAAMIHMQSIAKAALSDEQQLTTEIKS